MHNSSSVRLRMSPGNIELHVSCSSYTKPMYLAKEMRIYGMRRAKRKREKSIKQLAAAVELSRALGAPSTWTKRAYLLCIIFHSFHILIQYWNFIPWNQVPAYKVPFQVRRTVIIASKIQRQHLLPSLIPHSLDSFHSSSPPLAVISSVGQHSRHHRRPGEPFLPFNNMQHNCSSWKHKKSAVPLWMWEWTNCRHSTACA